MWWKAGEKSKGIILSTYIVTHTAYVYEFLEEQINFKM